MHGRFESDAQRFLFPVRDLQLNLILSSTMDFTKGIKVCLLHVLMVSSSMSNESAIDKC